MIKELKYLQVLDTTYSSLDLLLNGEHMNLLVQCDYFMDGLVS